MCPEFCVRCFILRPRFVFSVLPQVGSKAARTTGNLREKGAFCITCHQYIVSIISLSRVATECTDIKNISLHGAQGITPANERVNQHYSNRQMLSCSHPTCVHRHYKILEHIAACGPEVFLSVSQTERERIQLLDKFRRMGVESYHRAITNACWLLIKRLPTLSSVV